MGQLGKLSFWKAACSRALKTFLQSILGIWTAGQLITEIDWKIVLLAAASASVYSLLTSICAGLPEVTMSCDCDDYYNGTDENEGVIYEEGEDDYE